MDAIKFIKEANKMCNSFNSCCRCPASDSLGRCKFFHSNNYSAEEKLSIVEEWAKKHSIKTRQSVFLEQHPNAKRDCQDILCVCPAEIFGDTVCQKGPALCSDCRHKFWMQEVE